MGKILVKKIVPFCMLFFVICFSNTSWAIPISFNPSSAQIDIGESVSIDIIVSGLASDDLGAFDFDVNFDDSVLDFDSYVLGSDLGLIDPADPFADAEDLSFGYLGGGVVNLAEFSWLWDLSTQPTLLLWQPSLLPGMA